ncbi:MAG: hypothetical protein MHM6MM_001501 [Cercozoa sp. M6MM]
MCRRTVRIVWCVTGEVICLHENGRVRVSQTLSALEDELVSVMRRMPLPELQLTRSQVLHVVKSLEETPYVLVPRSDVENVIQQGTRRSLPSVRKALDDVLASFKSTNSNDRDESYSGVEVFVRGTSQYLRRVCDVAQIIVDIFDQLRGDATHVEWRLVCERVLPVVRSDCTIAHLEQAVIRAPSLYLVSASAAPASNGTSMTTGRWLSTVPCPPPPSSS